MEEIYKKTETINPELTQNFVESLTKKQETYRVDVRLGDRDIPIDVFPEVFPPKSDYSVSSKSVFETFGNLDGLVVADIGSGAGIESIVAVINGAEHVDAADINPQAVACAEHNVKLNKLSEKITVFQSDLFSHFPKRKYDFIIANLPIVNFDGGDTLIHKALYDKDLLLHKRLLAEAKDFLSEDGVIVFTHANLQSAKTNDPDYDFSSLENLIDQYGYKILERIERNDLEYTWINYKISPILQLQ